LVQEGVEQCDEGSMNSNDGKCLTDCTKAACGDGRVQTEAGTGEDVEVCDDGNNDDCGTCSKGCGEVWKQAEGSIVIDVNAFDPVDSGEGFVLTGMDLSILRFEYVVGFDSPGPATIPIELTLSQARDSGAIAALTILKINSPQVNSVLGVVASLSGSSVKLVYEHPGANGNREIDVIPDSEGHLIVSGMDGGTGQGLCGANVGCKIDADCLSNDCHNKRCR
jgi:hypothetical protein